MIQRSINNLIDNAIKYGDKVNIELSKNNNNLFIKIEDNGPGIHHISYEVDSVAETMKRWKDEQGIKFLSEEPLTCPGLTQVFTEPHPVTGIIYELIERESQGFCQENVKDLMESTSD